MGFLANLRQLQYPAEFRIAPPTWPPELASRLEELAERPVAGSQPDAADEPEDYRFLAQVATGLWRLRRKMVEPGTERPLAEMRRAYRHLQATWDSLAEAGLEILDHTDTPFDSGMSLKVLAFQPTPGLSRERVIETIKPTVYFADRHLQMGEVIVGTPEEAGGPPA